MANKTESLIGTTLPDYRAAGIAQIVFLNPPMRVAGSVGPMPCYVPTGKAPFDLGGFYYDKAATVIGVEIKETRDREHSLSIVQPEKKGSGLHYHQMEALVEVHKAGGMAVLVWNNAGEVGILRGDELHLTKVQYDASLKAEKAGKAPARGSRSILWGRFTVVQTGHKGKPLWLPPSPVLKRKAG